MRIVRRAAVVLMYLRRSGYNEAANALWLLIVMSEGNDRQLLINWLHCNGDITPLLNRVLFLSGGKEVIDIKAGFKSLNKLLAVLPKEIK